MLNSIPEHNILKIVLAINFASEVIFFADEAISCVNESVHF